MKKIFFVSSVLAYATCGLQAEYSLTAITSWFSNTSEKHYNKTLSIGQETSLTINNTQGNITIQGWSKPKIALDVVMSAKEKEIHDTTVEIVQDKTNKTIIVNTLQPHSKANISAHYEIMVPDYTPLTIATDSGDIKIRRSKARIHAQTGDGKVIIQDAKNSLFASTGNGAIDITYKRLRPGNILQVESDYGHITLGLPHPSNADIAAKTLHGTITTQQEVILKSQHVKLGPDAWKQFKQETYCTLGTGGATISLFTKSGNIKITES